VWARRLPGVPGQEGEAVVAIRSSAFHFMAVGNAAFADARVVIVQNAGGALDLFRSAFNFQVAVLQLRSDLQGGLKKLQVFVEGAE